MNVIETQRACWPFHTLDILSFELVVGHVSAVRTRLVTNEDESVAVVCCEGSLPVRVPLQCSVAREGSQYAPVRCPVVHPAGHVASRSRLGHVNERYYNCCMKQFQQLYGGSIMV